MNDDSDQTFEQGLQRLEEIVQALEDNELTLAQGMALYREGAAQARFCREKLNQAKVELEVWQDGAQPNADGI